MLDAADIGKRSHWLRQALGEDPSLQPSLEGDATADVCIVGGGYLGLWTAIRLKEQDPSLAVVLIERDICGGGPSGRNSGMLLGIWTKIAALAALCGEEEAFRLCALSIEAIDGIDDFCRSNGIDAWFDRVGWIWGATCRAQLGAWESSLAAFARRGLAPAHEIGRQEIAALAGTESHLGGVLDRTAATIHPGHLVRGLRRVALARGVAIYERTPMLRFARQGRPRVATPRGTVAAERLVLAMNAWSAGVPELAPALFVIASDDAASRPMRERLAAIAWSRGPLIIDSRVFVSGYRTTRDGRLVVGVTGGAIAFGGRIDKRFHAASPRVPDMRAALRTGHPALADFALDCAWRGPIDRTASGLPLFGRFPANPRILYGYGFSGNGIGLSYLGGQILASLALDRDDGWARCGLVRPVTRGFPPEPLRFVGAHLVRGAVRRRDRLEHEGRTPGRITTYLAGLAPSGVTPSRANLPTA